MRLSFVQLLFSTVQKWIQPDPTSHSLLSKPTIHYLDQFRREWDIQGTGISIVKATAEEHRIQIVLLGKANEHDPVDEEVS